AVKQALPDVVFHFSGQVAMTTSIANPRLDFEVNALGTLNLLEAVRLYVPEAGVLFSSTNKVYGDLGWAHFEEQETRYVSPDFPQGFPETIPLEFHSPYGCSKGCADQYVLDYHRIYGLRSTVFRHSSMFGGRQFPTVDQGWIGWFSKMAVMTKRGLMKEPFTISGNGKQVRDVLFVSDMVDLYLSASEKQDVVGGKVYNVGGGMSNSLSLLELFDLLERETGVTLTYKQVRPRQSDQKVFVADISKVSSDIGWKISVDKETGVKQMIEWITSIQ
ncbi:MAG: GDP-mannose 4,6-dehydratase, partial [Rhabdochlamydiaceae bacterium]